MDHISNVYKEKVLIYETRDDMERNLPDAANPNAFSDLVTEHCNITVVISALVGSSIYQPRLPLVVCMPVADMVPRQVPTTATPVASRAVICSLSSLAIATFLPSGLPMSSTLSSRNSVNSSLLVLTLLQSRILPRNSARLKTRRICWISASERAYLQAHCSRGGMGLFPSSREVTCPTKANRGTPGAVLLANIAYFGWEKNISQQSCVCVSVCA